MSALKHVVIVGGGTAGWLTAGILAADHRAHAADGLRVTVVESPTVPILGVGEGTWPSLRDTLRRIGVSETEFIRRCDASFKQGSRFNGWRDGGVGDSYLHPFDAPPGEDDLDVLSLWRAAGTGAFADAVSAQAKVCAAGRAPKQAQTPDFAAVTNYGYHLNAPALAQMLSEHCTQRLGVTLIHDDVVGVTKHEDGSIAHVETAHSGAVEGDLFVDCTGGRALLIGDEMSVPVKDVSDVLFNDRALAVHVPNVSPDQAIASQTDATALASGWVWDIALQSRRGVGYVFSSRHSDEAQARRDLDAYLAKHAAGADVTAADARLLKFKSGYRETPWVKNVVAIGMSQGFVEPLEASAIVMIELSAAMLSDLLPPMTSQLEPSARRFNERFSYRWARIVDFLKVHYVLTQRTEPYWQAHRDQDTWPDRLVDLMARWRFMPPSREDFTQALEIFPAASYAYVLYGMGYETEPRPHLRRKDVPDRAAQRLRDLQMKSQKLLSGLPTNRELLDHISGRARVGF